MGLCSSAPQVQKQNAPAQVQKQGSTQLGGKEQAAAAPSTTPVSVRAYGGAYG